GGGGRGAAAGGDEARAQLAGEGGGGAQVGGPARVRGVDDVRLPQGAGEPRRGVLEIADRGGAEEQTSGHRPQDRRGQRPRSTSRPARAGGGRQAARASTQTPAR